MTRAGDGEEGLAWAAEVPSTFQTLTQALLIWREEQHDPFSAQEYMLEMLRVRNF